MTFRDGVRSVPDHMEAVLSGIDTQRFTYKEAVAAGNRKLESDQIYRAQQEMIREHLKVKEF